MPAAGTQHDLRELDRIASELFDRRIRPTLRPEDDGKYVAIDINTGDFEIDVDDYSAVMRLRSRKPAAEMWLIRSGQPTTCRIGSGRADVID